jgi:hypothetical protein
LTGSFEKKSDLNSTRSDLLPAFSKGSSINAAAEKEDNMALMNLGTDTDFGFLNGLKRKNIIHFSKMQA